MMPMTEQIESTRSTHMMHQVNDPASASSTSDMSLVKRLSNRPAGVVS